jgi:predicted dithiol-disulfide oxidoreductase (DUF899 family)
MPEILIWDQFAKDLAAARGEEFVRDFCATLADEQRAEQEVVFARQKKVAAEIEAATNRLENTWVDGLGECHLRVDTTAYWYWVMREGREIWNDKTFLAEFKRDNPEVRVKSRSRKTMVTRL